MKFHTLFFSWILAFTVLSFAADPSEHLVLHYDFEDVTTSQVKNLAGQDVGIVKGDDPNAIKVAEDSPLIGQSALFCDATRRDAEATYVDSGQGISRLGIRKHPYTMMAWVKPLRHPRATRAGDVETIFGQERNAPASFSLGLGTNSQDQMRGMHGGWDNGQSSGTSVVERGVWQHLCWVQQNNRITMYKDGKLVDPQYETFPVIPLEYGADLIIGNSSTIGTVSEGDRFSFSGYIDDTRIYNRALSQEEIEAVKNSVLEPPRLNISLTPAGPRLNWSGLTPGTHTIEVSGDLERWELLDNEPPPARGQVIFWDSDPPTRYFRLAEP
ncbi:MAG: LamG domain-containing protein [Verrucomicrobiota bacterium]